MRERHIKWITNARVTRVEQDKMFVEEVAEDGSLKASHELPFAYSMMLPAFRGVPAVAGIEGLTNPRGFIAIDKYQRNPAFPNVFAIGDAVGGKLIMLEGTGPNDANWIADPKWKSIADEMSAAGMEALAATQARNPDSLNTAGDRLVAACEACHKKFKPDLPTMGLYKSPNYPPKSE